jgi:hypothetical protein
MGKQIYSENSRLNIPRRKFVPSIKEGRLRKAYDTGSQCRADAQTVETGMKQMARAFSHLVFQSNLLHSRI